MKLKAFFSGDVHWVIFKEIFELGSNFRSSNLKVQPP